MWAAQAWVAHGTKSTSDEHFQWWFGQIVACSPLKLTGAIHQQSTICPSLFQFLSYALLVSQVLIGAIKHIKICAEYQVMHRMVCPVHVAFSLEPQATMFTNPLCPIYLQGSICITRQSRLVYCMICIWGVFTCQEYSIFFLMFCT